MKIVSSADFSGIPVQNFVAEALVSDPVSPSVGQVWRNTTEDRLKWYDGSAVYTIAHKAEVDAIAATVSGIGSFQGDHDASTGAPAGAGLVAGDSFRITVAGTIAGVTPVATLAPGDLLVARVNTPSGGADFFAIEGNLVPSGGGTSDLARYSGTLAFAANTAVNLLTLSGFTTISSVQAHDASGIPVMLKFDGTNIESEVALSSISVIVIGE
jgi:hypothetical protein